MPNAKKAAKKVAKISAKKAAKQVPAKAVAKTSAKKMTKRAAAVETKSPKASAAKSVASKTATKGRPSMATKPTTIDDYLSHVDAETKQLLQALRQTIRKLVPDAEECISYSMPAFRWNGKVIGGFAATREGGSFYPFSGTTLDTLGDAALAGYGRTKSGLHFTSAKPLPLALVRKLLQARMAEVGR
jgi:uncharacterized protein YdhG (YjbR/CyaY superfamily)